MGCVVDEAFLSSPSSSSVAVSFSCLCPCTSSAYYTILLGASTQFVFLCS
eukprot:m.263929 g.263929  ORF g.263929 m.263929 type:complete len:50 (+) comp52986_c0_seq1:1478-1627(+)